MVTFAAAPSFLKVRAYMYSDPEILSLLIDPSSLATVMVIPAVDPSVVPAMMSIVLDLATPLKSATVMVAP